MSKKHEKKVRSKLRFPEFQGSGDWEEKELGDIASVIASGDLDEKTFSQKETDIHIYPIYSNSITKEGIYGYSSFPKYKSGSVTITARGTLGIAFVRNSDFVGIGRLLIVSDFDNVSSIFFKELWNHLAKIPLENGGIPQLTAVKAKSVLLLFPKLDEQRKIADTLSSLDDLIAVQSQKLKALQAHKKSLMQQLFPAEGERVPRLRFPEFLGAGDWEEKTLGDAGKFINGRAYKQEELLEKGKYRVLRVGNFFTNNHWYYSDLDLEDNKYCDRGDLLYAWSASFGPKIWNDEKVIYHYHIWKVVEKNDIDKKFLFLLLEYETEKIKNQKANGLGLLHITKNSIEAWGCSIPSKISEQQKIAATLFSLDDLIKTQNQKLEALKKYKKGLMQQLFPNPNDLA